MNIMTCTCGICELYFLYSAVPPRPRRRPGNMLRAEVCIVLQLNTRQYKTALQDYMYREDMYMYTECLDMRTDLSFD